MNDRLTHLPSRGRMLGETIPESLKETLSLELHVTADTPRTFIVLAEDDQAVSPLNSIVYYTALLKQGFLPDCIFIRKADIASDFVIASYIRSYGLMNCKNGC